MTPVETAVTTAEELLRMPAGNMRHELVNGELITMAPAGAEHGEIAVAIAIRLGTYVREHRLGQTYSSDTGFVLSRNPDTVRAPDASFVKGERVVRVKEYFPGAPDLAIEVISPGDSYSEVEAKVREYLRAGSLMVIVIDPAERTATIRTPSAPTQYLSINDTLDGGDVVPGWRLPLRELFER